MPRPFHPTTRAEALAAPLADVRQAASEDRAYLFGLAQIVADLLKPAEATATTAETTDPEQPATPADVRAAWKNAIQTRLHHG